MRTATTFCMFIFAALGVGWTAFYWDGLAAWLRFCSLPYAQVQGTPSEPMWTSRRGAIGVLILMMVVMWAVTVWRCRRDQAKTSSDQQQQSNERAKT